MTGVVLVNPRTKFTNSSGVPIAGGTVTVYLAGTTTLATTYQDKTLLTANTNPITLDANGECLLWADSAYTYKILLADAQGATVSGYPVDNIPGAADIGAAAVAGAAAASASATAAAASAAAAATAQTAAETAETNAEDALAVAQALYADVRFSTKALMDADLAHAAGSFAVVYADSTASNNGQYYKVGGSGSGSWTAYQGDRVTLAELKTTAAVGDTYTLGSLVTYGATTPDTTTYSSAFTDTFFPADASAARGYIDSFSVRTAGGAGTGQVVVIEPHPYSQHDYVVKAVTAVSVANGVNTWTGAQIYTGVLKAGSRIGYRILTTAGVRYVAGGPVKRIQTSAQTVGNSISGSLLDYAQNVAVAFTMRPAATDSLDERVTDLEDGSGSIGIALAALLGTDVAASSETTGDATLTATSTLPAGTLVVSCQPTTQPGVLTSVSFPTSNLFSDPAGTLYAGRIAIGTPNAAGSIIVTSVYEIKYQPGSVNTFTGFGDLVLPTGSYVMLQVDSARGLFQYKSGTADGGGYSVNHGSTLAVSQTVALAVYANTPIMEYTLKVNADGVGPRVETAESKLDLLMGSSDPVMLERTGFTGTSLPTGWVSAGAWTVNNGLTPPAAGGWGVTTLSGTHTAISKRNMPWRVQINSTDTITGICTSPPENIMGAALLIDGVAGKLRLYTFNDTGVAGTLLNETALPAALTAGRSYLLQLDKSDFTLTCMFKDTVTQASCSFTYDGTLFGPTMSPGKCGAIFLSATTPPVYEWAEYLAPYPRRCRALIIGDSITEGSYLGTTGLTWARQIAAARSAKNDVVLAGRAGDETPNFLFRKGLDQDIWLPDYTLIALGTNDTSQDIWRTNIATMIEQAEDNGSEPILCTQVPRTASQALRTAMNADIRAYYFGKYRYIDMAIPVSASNLGVAWNATYDFGDGIHPNQAGHNLMYAQAQIDAPFLFV